MPFLPYKRPSYHINALPTLPACPWAVGGTYWRHTDPFSNESYKVPTWLCCKGNYTHHPLVGGKFIELYCQTLTGLCFVFASFTSVLMSVHSLARCDFILRFRTCFEDSVE